MGDPRLGSALRDPAAFDPLVARLGDHSATVREWATRALGALEDPRAIVHLERRLDDESATVRRWAERALSHLRGA